MKHDKVIDFEHKKTAYEFERALADKPVEEQLAVSLIAPNVLNGCSWVFCRRDPVIRRYEAEFKQSKTCKLQNVTYHRGEGIKGYLVSINLDRLLSLLGPFNNGPLHSEEVETARQRHSEALEELGNRIRSGYQGYIGIYNTSDTQIITIQDKTFPAYSVTLRELCLECEKNNYGILIGDVSRNPREVLARENEVIEALLIAPSCDSLIIKIAPMYDTQYL